MLDVHERCIISHNIGLDWYVQNWSKLCVFLPLHLEGSQMTLFCNVRLQTPKVSHAGVFLSIYFKGHQEEVIKWGATPLENSRYGWSIFQESWRLFFASSWEVLQGATTKNLDEDITQLNPVANSILRIPPLAIPHKLQDTTPGKLKDCNGRTPPIFCG